MNPAEEAINRLKKMKSGEEVKCKHCGKGIMQPVGDYKTTHCFVCDNCHARLNIN